MLKRRDTLDKEKHLFTVISSEVEDLDDHKRELFTIRVQSQGRNTEFISLRDQRKRTNWCNKISIIFCSTQLLYKIVANTSLYESPI
jgi:hypothetical protein